MGEIMRWRLTRPAQRRVPDPTTTLNLPNPFQIEPIIQGAEALNQAAIQQAIATYQKMLSNTSTLRQYLSAANVAGTPPNARLTPNVFNLFVGLWKLDQWLAANNPVPPAYPPYSQPTVAGLTAQVNALLGNPLPVEWATLGQIIADIYYVALILSAWGVSFSLTEALGVLTRWLLVIGLVNDLQVNPSPIQTPDGIYSDLRWRTPVLPDIVSLVLWAIRSHKKAVLVRKPGFADLYVTREEWDHYEPAEIASIENILKGELIDRVHILVNQTQVTTTTEQSTTQVKEQDTTTTDLTQLQQQSSSDISIAAHVDGQVDTSGLYGSTQVNTHLGGSLDYSNSSSTSKATTQSHETVSRAVSKIEQTTTQIRTVSTLTRDKDKEEHKFDNQQGVGPVVGIYRWVDQIQNVELDRYPHRFLMEFEIPEPGAWTRWLHQNDLAKDMVNKPPAPLTLDGTNNSRALQPTDVTAASYSGYCARYAVSGVSAPPEPLTIAANIGYPTDPSTVPLVQDFRYTANTNVSIPNGYFAVNWNASLMYMTGGSKAFPDCQIAVAVGAGPPVTSPTPVAVVGPYTNITDEIVGALVGPISQGAIPVAVQVINNTGFEVSVEVNCQPLDQTVQQWQNDTYALIVGAYNGLLQAYNDELAGLNIQQTNLVDANSPDQNATTITQELKRQVIEMLGVTTTSPNPPQPPPPPNFFGLNAIKWDDPNVPAPYNLLDKAALFAPTIQFLEQAFEWETLSYICYPYYWADSSRWAGLAVIQGNDQNFADFLRAGSARVVLAARPGFENQVNFFVQYGIVWGGGPMPAPGDPDYLSIADEVMEMQQRPSDVTVIDTWQVRIPTTLIWLQNENPEGQLPTNPNPTIDTSPTIVALSPASGAVGDTVTISGRNFGEIQGTSTITFFNGVVASPTNWSATSIDVTVPNGAVTGNVVVTVKSIGGDGVTINALTSNGVNFTVN